MKLYAKRSAVINFEMKEKKLKWRKRQQMRIREEETESKNDEI